MRAMVAARPKVKEATIRDFLQEVKHAITRTTKWDMGWRLVRRKENINCLGELGFNYADIQSVMLELVVTDYCDGPLEDPGMPGELWVFGKVIQGKEVYIKLKVATFARLRIVRVVSFHFANESLCYPLREHKESDKKTGNERRD